MRQLSFRLPENVLDEFERGRKAQGFTNGTEYVTHLILEGAGLKSGLSAPVWEPAAQDARVSFQVSQAIIALNRGKPDDALAALRIAQDFIMDVTLKRGATIVEATVARVRVRGGGDDWIG